VRVHRVGGGWARSPPFVSPPSRGGWVRGGQPPPSLVLSKIPLTAYLLGKYATKNLTPKTHREAEPILPLPSLHQCCVKSIIGPSPGRVGPELIDKPSN